jgi:CheY-like chemotaxis protein
MVQRRHEPSDVSYTPIGEAMSRDVHCVRADADAASAASVLRARGLDAVPVVDDDGRVEGLLLAVDLLRHADALGEVGAGALALRDVPTLLRSTPIATAAAVMAFEGITCVPVVGEGGRFVGVVSALDVLRWVARESGYLVPAEGRQQQRMVPGAGHHRVVVADDDEDMRRLVSHALEKDQWEVIEVADGAELLDYMGSSMLEEPGAARPDLIISDIRMPGFNGLQVLAGLKRANVDTPVVLITALEDQKVYTDAEKLGAAAIFRKPFDTGQLMRLVRDLVN